MATNFLAYFGSKRKAVSLEEQTEDNANGAKKLKSSEYEFNLDKLQKYQKEFRFWNTPNQTACDDSTKHISWLEIKASQKMFCCWVCQQYMSVANKDNEVTKGTFYLFYTIPKLFCLFCVFGKTMNAFLSYSITTIGTDKCHKNYLKRHENDTKHKDAVARYIREQHQDDDMSVAPLEACVFKSKNSMSSEKKKQLKVLFNTSYWIAKEGIAFNKFASLCKLQAKNTLSVGENYTNIMGCRMFIKAISETMFQSVAKDMKNARFLSYLSDGSTDAGIREQEIVYSRYVKDGVPVTKYLGIKQLEHAHADGTLSAIEAALCDHLKTTEVVYEKGVNCNFDGASVMSGRLSGVRTKMQQKQPGMVFTHCIAHNLELAVLDSIKSDTSLERLEATLSAMFLCYYHSPKKRREIKAISDLIEDTFKQFGGLKHVRWLASRHRALSIIESDYTALVMHQENIAESNDINAATAKGHVKDIKSVWFVFYLHFMMDYVATLRSTSLLFQKDTLFVCVLNRVIESRISLFESLKQRRGSNYKRLFDNIKLEDDAIVYKTTTLNKPCGGRRRADIDADHHSIEHYSELYDGKFRVILSDTQTYLRRRFSDLQHPPLSWMTVFDFKVWPRSFTKEDVAFGYMEIESLADYYREHGFLKDDEACAIPLEWPLLRSRILPLRTHDVSDVYRDLMLENDEEIRSILILVKLMATISPSTASCERGFSAMNREKTSLRTSLSDGMLQDILRISINGVSLAEFDSESALDQWLSLAKKRHLMH